MAKGARVEPDGDVVVTIALTTAGCPLRAQIQRDVRARVGSLPGVTHVTLDWTEMTQEEKSSAMAKARWNVAQRPEDTALGRHHEGRAGGVRQGRRRQVVGHRQPGRRAGGHRPHGRACSTPTSGASPCRGCSASPGRLAGEERDGKKLMIPHERPVGDGLLRIISMGFLVEDEEQALDVARPDAQPRRHALPAGRRVGRRPRLPLRRHAARHRRRADGRGQAAAPRRGARGHHAGARLRRRWPAGRCRWPARASCAWPA